MQALVPEETRQHDARCRCYECERRRDLIIALRTLRDVGETLQRGDSGGRFVPSSRLMMMPAAWHAGCPPECVGRGGSGVDRHGRRVACESTYVKVLAACVTLRERRPAHYWHLSQRYLVSQRGTRGLVREPTARKPRYWEAVRRERWQGETYTVRYEIGDPFPLDHAEVLTFVPDLRAPVKRREGVSPHAQLVWAGIERWNEKVCQRVVRQALGGLLRLLPGELVLPKDVRDGVYAQRAA